VSSIKSVVVTAYATVSDVIVIDVLSSVVIAHSAGLRIFFFPLSK
jgi:hypothetical protein